MGNLSTVQPRTIAAKVAERLGEIDAARERGVTLRSNAEAIGDAEVAIEVIDSYPWPPAIME